MRFIAVFFAMFFTDIFWTMLVRKTTQGKALAAAIYSVILVLLSAVAITSFVEETIYLVPAALGAFAGTYLTVKINEWR